MMACRSHQITNTNVLRRIILYQLRFTKSLWSSVPKGKIQSKTPCPNVNSVDSATADDSVNAITNMDYKRECCESDYDSSDDNMVESISSSTLEIELWNTTLQTRNTNVAFQLIL